MLEMKEVFTQKLDGAQKSDHDTILTGTTTADSQNSQTETIGSSLKKKIVKKLKNVEDTFRRWSGTEKDVLPFYNPPESRINPPRSATETMKINFRIAMVLGVALVVVFGMTLIHMHQGEVQGSRNLMGDGSEEEESESEGPYEKLYSAIDSCGITCWDLTKLLRGAIDAETLSRGLYYAAIEGKEKALKRLLENGAEINAQDRKKNTVLHYAATAGHPEAVRELLCNGASQIINNKDDETPRNMATEKMRSLQKMMDATKDKKALKSYEKKRSKIQQAVKEFSDFKKYGC